MNFRPQYPVKRGNSVARYVPDRNDIVWLDFEPTKGKEIGKYRPALVLSGKAYNKATGLLICCPISSSICKAPTEVPINNLDTPSVVAANLVTTLDWRVRKGELDEEVGTESIFYHPGFFG